MALDHARRAHLQTTLVTIQLPRPPRGSRRSLEHGSALAMLDLDGAEREELARSFPNAARLVDALADPTGGEIVRVLADDDSVDANALVRHVATKRLARLETWSRRFDEALEQADAERADRFVTRQLAAITSVQEEDERRHARVQRALQSASPARQTTVRSMLRQGGRRLDALLDEVERESSLPPIAVAASGQPALPAHAVERMRARVRLTAAGRTRERRAQDVIDDAEPTSAKRAVEGLMREVGVSDVTQMAPSLSAQRDELLALQAVATATSLTEPFGYLHLERLSYAPAAVEHGELVYSLPLAPGEEVSIAHKEWSNTEEEFSRLVADQFEDYSERGVVDKTDISEASSAQRSHSTSFSVSVSASGGFGPMSASASTSFNANSSEASSRQSTITQSQQITKKASSRARKEHRITFRLAKKTHIEDQTTRKIRNPDPLHPVRYDYYQLLRKWRVDLHRYGVRLTYDLTIPQPAVDLLASYRAIRVIDHMLEQLPTFTPPEVTRTNWAQLARTHGVVLEPPPPETVSVQSTKVLGPYTDDGLREHHDELRVAVPEGYEYVSEDRIAWAAFGGPDDAFTDFAHTMHGHDGHPDVTTEIVYPVSILDRKGGYASVRVWFQVRPELEQTWRTKCSAALRENAEKSYAELRQRLEQKKERLAAEIAPRDALTLRKLEREEIMKGTLRWLLGPSFDLAPPPYHYESDGAVATNAHAQTLMFGRMVSFLHQAIEWENISYFLYPYFWTPQETWKERIRLAHQDPVHEAFLRAGAARVVLPIRPGWEKAFLAFSQTKDMNAVLPSAHPYMTVAEELEAFARTNYPGIVPANPEDVDPDAATAAAEGKLVASWFEYTPTGALDLVVGERAPAEGAFRDPSFSPGSLFGHISPLIQSAAAVMDALATRLTKP